MVKTPSEPGYNERQKLIAAMEKRVNRAIKAIRLVGKLDSNPALDGEDIAVMHNALDEELSAMVSRLTTGRQSQPEWTRHNEVPAETGGALQA